MSDELDPGYGQLMLFVFILAVLFVTGIVALLSSIQSWGMLALAFGLHLLTTGGVSWVIARGLAGRTRLRRASAPAATTARTATGATGATGATVAPAPGAPSAA